MFRQGCRNISACSLLVLALAAFGACEPISQLKPSGYVNDYANVLDSESVRQMQHLCAQIEQKAQAQVAVVTVNSLNGATIDAYAHRLFRQWGIGPKSNNRGILILLAVGDRKYRIEVGTGLEAVVTDRKAAGFGREAVPYLKQTQYGTALRMITRRVADAIAADAQVTIPDAPPPTPTPAPANYSSPSNGDFYYAFIAIFIVVGVVIIIVYLIVGPSGYSGPYYGRRYVYRSYYGYPSGGYITTNNYYGGFGSTAAVSAPPADSGWSGGGGFGGGGSFSGFGGGSSSGAGASGDYSDSSSSSGSDDSSSSSSSWSSDSSSSDSSSSSSDSGSSDSGSSDSGGGDSGGGASGDY